LFKTITQSKSNSNNQTEEIEMT